MTFDQWAKSLPESEREAAIERSAILEFDAGLTREEAEAKARQELGL